MSQCPKDRNIRLGNSYYGKIKKKLTGLNYELEFMSDYLNSTTHFLEIFRCIPLCSHTPPQFKRAFLTLTHLEQSELFYNYTYISYYLLNNVPQNPNVPNQKYQILKIFVLSSITWKWSIKCIQLDFEAKKLKFLDDDIEVNLRNFIIRKSRNNLKNSLVLQSTSRLEYLQTIRISNYGEQYQSFARKIDTIMNLSLRQRIQRKYGILNNFCQDKSKNQNTSFDEKLANCNKKTTARSSLSTINIQGKLELQNGANQYPFQKIQVNLSRYDGFTKIRPGVYFDKLNNVIKKCFSVPVQSNSDALNWITTNMLNFNTFKRWKKSLLTANLLSNHQQSYIFSQSHQYENGVIRRYIYRRTKIFKNNIVYFYDQTTPKQIQEYNPDAIIKYCIFKIQNLKQKLSITIQAKVDHGIQYNDQQGEILQLSDQFIGDISNLFCGIEQQIKLRQMDINSSIFDEVCLSKISSFDKSIAEFYSISQLNDRDITKNSQIQ